MWKKAPEASGNQDSGDPCAFHRDRARSRNGVMGSFPADHPLHEGITDHKVGGRGILVKEKDFTSGLYGASPRYRQPGMPLASSVEKQLIFGGRSLIKKRNVPSLIKTGRPQNHILCRRIGNDISRFHRPEM